MKTRAELRVTKEHLEKLASKYTSFSQMALALDCSPETVSRLCNDFEVESPSQRQMRQQSLEKELDGSYSKDTENLREKFIGDKKEDSFDVEMAKRRINWYMKPPPLNRLTLREIEKDYGKKMNTHFLTDYDRTALKHTSTGELKRICRGIKSFIRGRKEVRKVKINTNYDKDDWWQWIPEKELAASIRLLFEELQYRNSDENDKASF